MTVVNLTAVFDPVLAEHYPGHGMKMRVASETDGYEVVLATGRTIPLSSAVVESAVGDRTDAWERLFDIIDAALKDKG